MPNTITMKRLGRFGQWGNQVVQYAFVRSYAMANGLTYQLPTWAGQYLFGFVDPPITYHFPPFTEAVVTHRPGRIGVPIPPAAGELANRDFQGWGQYDTAYYQPHKQFIQRLYRAPVDPQRSRVATALESLQSRGATLIGLHLRRGDSGRVIYPFTPIAWCLRWLHDNWKRFPCPVLFVATEDASLMDHFRGYDCCAAEDLGITFELREYPGYIYPFKIEPHKARMLDFFPDWYLLQHCDVVLASDSSFSMTAAWTSTIVRETWRPKLSLGGFERIDPWSMPFCNREHLDDFPGIPGTALDDNPGMGWEGFTPTHKAVPEDPVIFTQWLTPP